MTGQPWGYHEPVPLQVAREDAPGAALPTDRNVGSRLVNLARAVRARQWTKNLLVFVAPASAGVLSSAKDLLEALATFLIFCAAASAVYLVNDVMDASSDRLHPDKRHRPVASGALSSKLALPVAAALMGAAEVAAAFVGPWSLSLVLSVYLGISFAYSLGLKRVPVVELVAVASGFVLRAIAGGVADHVPLSNWMLAVASFGALFVVTGKRSSEHALMGDMGRAHRSVLATYTDSFLRSTLTLTATVTVTAYCLWAFENGGLAAQAGHQHIWIELTVVPVVVVLVQVLYAWHCGTKNFPDPQPRVPATQSISRVAILAKRLGEPKRVALRCDARSILESVNPTSNSPRRVHLKNSYGVEVIALCGCRPDPAPDAELITLRDGAPLPPDRVIRYLPPPASESAAGDDARLDGVRDTRVNTPRAPIEKSRMVSDPLSATNSCRSAPATAREADFISGETKGELPASFSTPSATIRSTRIPLPVSPTNRSLEAPSEVSAVSCALPAPSGAMCNRGPTTPLLGSKENASTPPSPSAANRLRLSGEK